MTTDKYQRGIDILRKRDNHKSRVKRHIYLMRGLLWLDVEGKNYRLYGSTPRGRTKIYSYYYTQAKPNGKKVHVPCQMVDDQIPDFLRSISVEPDLFAGIRYVYEDQIKVVKQDDHDIKRRELERRRTLLMEEESRLARLYITGKLEEQSYDQLRKEWQDKLRNIEINLTELERDLSVHMDDLDIALVLMTKLGVLYQRLEKKEQSLLLQILIKRIIVNATGAIVSCELNSPFAYLQSIAEGFLGKESTKSGSKQVPPGAHLRPEPKQDDLVPFLSLLRFEGKKKANQLLKTL